MLKRNTSGLEAHAQQKRESALKRTYEAIARLVKDKRPVNFKTVSEESGVSRTWLYKEPKIKARINEIKNKKNTKYRSKKNTSNQGNNQLIDTSQIDEYKTKIRKLETENCTLRNHLEVVYGMTDPQLVEKVKVLQQENESLKLRLNENSHQADRQLEERIQDLESENQKLLQENKQVDQLKIDLVLAEQKICEYEHRTVEQAKNDSNPKLVVLEPKKRTPGGEVDSTCRGSKKQSTDSGSTLDTIQPRLKNIGVRLNKKLKEIILSLSIEEVQNAVSAVEEYLATGKKVKSKAGLLRKALEEAWIPNLTEEERIISQTKDTFSAWYKLAKEEGIVQASQGTKKGILVLEPTGEWTPFEAMLEKGWTLKYLEERTKR